MPQLIVENDPYAASTGEALGSLVDGFGGPSIKQQAEAQALMSRIQLANQQQQALAAKMRQDQQKFSWEEQDRKANQIAQDAAGRMWGIAPPKPVAVNGMEPSRDDMEKWYREQNYYDQMSRQMVRSGKGANDIATSMGSIQKAFQDRVPGSSDPVFNSDKTARLIPDANDPSGFRSVPIAGAAATKAPTPDQSNAATFSQRMQQANDVIGRPDISTAGTSYIEKGRGMLGNWAASTEFQQLDQASKNFIYAQLRKESGASISPGEYSSALDTYIPQPGDSPERLALKKQARDTAIAGMIRSSGSAGAQSAQPSQPQGMPDGARQAPDGHWYVQQNGKFFRVDP